MHVIEGCFSASEKVESLRKEEAVGEFFYFSGFCLPQCQQLAGTKEQAGYCWSAHSRCLDGHMVLHVRGDVCLSFINLSICHCNTIL